MSLQARPTKELEWASSPVLVSGQSNIQEPDTTQRQQGWVIQKPSLQHFNWWMNLAWLWDKFLDQRVPNTNAIRITAAGGYTIPGRSTMLFCDATLGAQLVTLPTITSADDGLEVFVKKIDASVNTVTIVGTIDGEVNSVIEYQYTGRTCVAQNGAWFWKA